MQIMPFLLRAWTLAIVVGGAFLPADARAADQPASAITPTQPDSPMRITITLRDTTLFATLNDTPAAKDFVTMLPLTLPLEDYARSEKIGYPSRKLTTAGSPAGVGGPAGTIAYYAPWGNLVLYYENFRPDDGVFILGAVDGAIDALRVPGPLTVTIDRAR